MSRYIRRIVKKILPQSVQSFIQCKLKERNDWRIMEKTLAQYNNMCSPDIPGFVILDPYVKTDRIFNGIQYYSQVYQDYYLDHYVFHEKENGIFLDVGGNDPIYINNTYFFELNRNWTGLAFEPMPKMHQRWKESRKVQCIQVALGSRKGEMEFCEYEEDYMSGLVSNVDYNGKVAKNYKVNIVTLGSILKKYKITHVDFISLDVEGAELDVLNGIDFSAVVIDYFVIENNKGFEKEQEIRRFLIKKHYKLKAKLWIDEIWEREKD